MTPQAARELSPTIAVHGVSHRFRRRLVLDRLTVDVGIGVCGLLGPNGAGKTTLMRLLATIYPVQSGRIQVLGFNLDGDRERRQARRRIGYLPQSFGTFPGFTVSEFVEYFALLRGVPPNNVKFAVEGAIDLVGLTDRITSKMKTLSGGMVRRAGLAQAIVHSPEVLLLDEPTAGLDPEQRVAIRGVLLGIARERTVVLSTHVIEDLDALGGRILVIGDGRLRFDGSSDALANLGDVARDGDRRSALERGYAKTLVPDGRREAA